MRTMSQQHFLSFFIVCIIFQYVLCQSRDLPDYWKEQILNSKDDVEQILQHLFHGDGKGSTYAELADLVDGIGPRVAGGLELEEAIDYMIENLSEEFGDDNVYTEEVTFPLWTRGEEWATLLSPREVDLSLTSLFLSPPGNVTAEVIVVSSFEELDEKQDLVPGKIVVYNQEWTDYGGSVDYRSNGASRASAYGAVGALVRSATGHSIYSPHTGGQTWQEGVDVIPVACITVEDAQMLHRMYNRSEEIWINIYMDHVVDFETNGTSRNLIAEIPGEEFPDQYLIFGGHFDSWDMGTGAMDDAGGCFVMKQIISTIKALDLKPKRTMRLVFWTAEEVGIYGGDQYYYRHKGELASNVSIIMESDMGTFDPRGIGLHNVSGLAQAIMEEIVETYLSDYGMGQIAPGGGTADIYRWFRDGVPGVSLTTANEQYFDFHHTHGDTMTVEDPGELDRCSALLAVTSYVVSNLDVLLPRDGEYPDSGASHSSGKLWILIIPLWFLVHVLNYV